MPSSKGETPQIYVGETSYDKIDINNLKILGCTGKKNPTNFFFTDGNHNYKYTSADSQLHMNFMNKDIICEEWDVKYADDAYSVFSKIADMVYPDIDMSAVAESKSEYGTLNKPKYLKEEPVESYCWTIWNKKGETELYSGFNSFYGTGSKMGKEQRKKRIEKIYESFKGKVDEKILIEVRKGLNSFLLEPASTSEEKAMKVRLREYILKLTKSVSNSEFENRIAKVLFRPMDEMYIPIPDSGQFHKKHPDFFGKNFGKVKSGTSNLELPKDQRRFNLVFDPSGDSLPAYITQDNGKAIESAEKQTYLGEWILRGIFQLKKYEPLTSKKLMELNINGLRFSRYKDSDDVHLEFIWIDETNPPKGYIAKI
ncbi:MAG TPA: NgoFVII family restriction endonuclease [Candidatus Merdenecus merdavium]|nr:NgoFVII family restriction endonuclease [Candidatus Merdenecus merdavium]